MKTTSSIIGRILSEVDHLQSINGRMPDHQTLRLKKAVLALVEQQLHRVPADEAENMECLREGLLGFIADYDEPPLA